MEFKKNIEGKNIRFQVSPWTFKTTIELDNETIYSSWEITGWAIFYEILMFGLGILLGFIYVIGKNL